MTEEEEFIARLACLCLSRLQLWNVSLDDGILCVAPDQRLDHGDTKYQFLQDVYLTELNKVIPAGKPFTFNELFPYK